MKLRFCAVGVCLALCMTALAGCSNPNDAEATAEALPYEESTEASVSEDAVDYESEFMQGFLASEDPLLRAAGFVEFDGGATLGAIVIRSDEVNDDLIEGDFTTRFSKAFSSIYEVFCSETALGFVDEKAGVVMIIPIGYSAEGNMSLVTERGVPTDSLWGTESTEETDCMRIVCIDLFGGTAIDGTDLGFNYPMYKLKVAAAEVDRIVCTCDPFHTLHHVAEGNRVRWYVDGSTDLQTFSIYYMASDFDGVVTHTVDSVDNNTLFGVEGYGVAGTFPADLILEELCLTDASAEVSEDGADEFNVGEGESAVPDGDLVKRNGVLRVVTVRCFSQGFVWVDPDSGEGVDSMLDSLGVLESAIANK